jgi:hypothetical protein
MGNCGIKEAPPGLPGGEERKINEIEIESFGIAGAFSFA